MMFLSLYAETTMMARMFRAAEATIKALTPGAGHALDAAVAEATHGLFIAAAGHSPVWYGVLQAAHRGEANGARGRVFIAPGITHPLGGHPDQYGPDVHRRKPWFTWTLDQDAPAILEHATFQLSADISDAWDGRILS